MEQTIKHISERLVSTLPKEYETYKLGDLRHHGFPLFVVKRVRVELQRNLAESIILPDTDWADMESETVRQAWDQFVSAIRAQARLPKSYAYPVVETAISDIMEILVQPRKNLPEVIFGADEILSYDELVDRLDVVVVYRHFASLLPRYMERKNYLELSKIQCANIVAQADKRLTERYTPLNWAQMLEPLFTLTDEQVDSNLLRLFFEDKNRPRMARLFDMMNRTLNRSEVIEALSTPDLPDNEEQSELFGTLKERPKPPYTSWEGLVKPVERGEFDSASQADTETHSEQRDSDEGESLNTLFRNDLEQEQQNLRPFDQDAAENALNEIFSETEDREQAEPEHRKPHEEHGEMGSGDIESRSRQDTENQPEQAGDREPEEESSQLVNLFREENETEHDRDQERDRQEDRHRDPTIEQQVSWVDEDTGEENDIETEEDAPIWRTFVSDEDLAEEDQESSDDEEEPLIDLTSDDKPDRQQMDALMKLLENDRDRFVEEIFRGAEEAYEQALEDIAARDDWRSASQYIEKEVFKRNLVDMYSEVAVDFTDRLHSYFIETASSS
ncbi:MAG: hypothetical protein R3281_04930 [Balneolaceae bacterium]|nr:hypothetical protein [Balneolaceae bacterium]